MVGAQALQSYARLVGKRGGHYYIGASGQKVYGEPPTGRRLAAGEASAKPNRQAPPKEQATVESIRRQISQYPRTKLDLDSSDAGAHAEQVRKAQIAQVESHFTSHEKKALARYLEGGGFQDMRSAQMGGPPPEARAAAIQLDRGVARLERRSDPITLYRGLHVEPHIAQKLMNSETFDTRATSFFSSTPDVATSFARGFSKADRANHVGVIVVGKIRGVAVEPKDGYGCESLVRAKQLKVTRRESFEHPTAGHMLVLHVED